MRGHKTSPEIFLNFIFIVELHCNNVYYSHKALPYGSCFIHGVVKHKCDCPDIKSINVALLELGTLGNYVDN